MAFQLLTGRFPFDDRRNPLQPSVTKIWYITSPESRSHSLQGQVIACCPRNILSKDCLSMDQMKVRQCCQFIFDCSAASPDFDHNWGGRIIHRQIVVVRPHCQEKQYASINLTPFLPVYRQSILCDNVDFKKSYWSGISEEAQQFVARLLQKDPEKRPTAEEALCMPWLRGQVKERATGEPLCNQVVQRIQVRQVLSCRTVEKGGTCHEIFIVE